VPAFLPSELPIRAVARQHWIVLFRKPRRSTVILLVVLLVCGFIWPWPMSWVFVLVAGLLASLRYREWRAERVILTGKRIIHVQGILETSSSESSLRLDRISGIRFIETVPGKVLNYANIELEAPGNHPGISRLLRMRRPGRFYLELRQIVFVEDGRPDPDEEPIADEPSDYVTAPIPAVPTDRDRFGRRRY
jgi:hypothetical protein